MNKRSDRLQRVHKFVEAEEQQHCRALGTAQRRLEQQLQRLDELKAYRAEYAGKLPAGGNISSMRWHDYQNFLRRLDDAVAAQTTAVMSGRQNCDAHRQRWLVKHQRVESLQRVVDGYRNAESRYRDRLVQKTLDDLPQRPDAFRRR